MVHADQPGKQDADVGIGEENQERGRSPEQAQPPSRTRFLRPWYRRHGRADAPTQPPPDARNLPGVVSFAAQGSPWQFSSPSRHFAQDGIIAVNSP